MLKQKFFYPLIEDFDKNFFKMLQVAVKERYEFVGNNEDKIFFIKTLLCFQILKDYRAPLHVIKKYLRKKINLKIINEKIKAKNFEIDYSWAVWTRDKEMGKLAEKFFKSNPKIIGTDNEFNEFVLRYLVSIWLAGWEGPLYAILQSAKDGTVHLNELNEILSLWDFTKIFNYF